MNFLVPAFLLGALAIAVPVILHLRHRDKEKPFRFPSLMFLEQLPIRTAQRRRVTDWPLLLLRALALLLLALAFARPVFTKRAATAADTRARAVVVMLDRSMSMGHRDVWPAALDSAKRIIGALGARDRVGVVFFDDAAEVAQRLTEDKAAAASILGTAKPMGRGTRFAPALRAARQMLLDAPFAAAEIVVVSDLQRAGTSGIAGIDLPAGVTLRAVNVGARERGNSAVRSVDARRLVDNTGTGTRMTLGVKARIGSRDLAGPRSALATLVVNGRDASSQRVTLPANGEATVSFEPTLVPESDVVAMVRVEDDALTGDDRFNFVVPRDDAVRVALVAPGDARNDETLFIERALAIGRVPEIRVDRMRGAATDIAAMRSAPILMFVDVLPTSATRAAVNDVLERGGGIVIVAGRRLGAVRQLDADIAALVPARITGLADRTVDRGGTLANVRYEHPLFAPFRATEDALSSVRFLRYPRMDVTAGADVLARFDDGLPAIVEKKSGNGRIVLVATGLDPSTGDFPLQPAFLPFLRQLVLHTSGRDATPLWRTTADNWAIPEGIADPVVRSPDESLVRPVRDTAGSAVPLSDAGVYAAFATSASGEPRAQTAVNAPASESDLTPIDPKELLLGVRTSQTLGAADSLPTTPDAMERRQGLWRILLVVVALALLGETFMATRGSRAVARRFPQGTAATAAPAGSDRRGQ